MNLSETIRALNPDAAKQYSQEDKQEAVAKALELVKHHVRWEQDCFGIEQSSASEAWDKNKNFVSINEYAHRPWSCCMRR